MTTGTEWWNSAVAVIMLSHQLPPVAYGNILSEGEWEGNTMQKSPKFVFSVLAVLGSTNSKHRLNSKSSLDYLTFLFQIWRKNDKPKPIIHALYFKYPAWFRRSLRYAHVLYYHGPQGGKIEVLAVKNESARGVRVDKVNELSSLMTRICLCLT